jgi:tetratricopeptide (TPR) repeat protein
MISTNKSHLVIGFIFLLMTSLVQANEEDKQFLLTQETYELLNEVRKIMEEEEHETAIKKLNSYLGKNNLKPYGKAVINQTLGYAYNSQENFPRSIESFLTAINANSLPDKVTHELNYIIAQLYLHSEKYTEGLAYLDKWFNKETEPTSEAHLLAATAYYQTNNFKKIIPHAKSAIEKSDSPQQSWYELLIAAYYETKMFRNAATLLETMINKYPDNNSYWLQLAAVYQQNKQEKKALAVSELAYEKGILKNDDIIQLAQTYLYLQLPLKAATLLDTEINNGNIEASKTNIGLLTDSWLLAHEEEKAALLLERFTPKLSDISLYYKLGHIYVELENWEKAKNTLESVVSEEALKSQKEIQASAWLLLGISSYHQKDTLRSTQALNKALAFKETKDQATWWLKQLEEESTGKMDNET